MRYVRPIICLVALRLLLRIYLPLPLIIRRDIWNLLAWVYFLPYHLAANNPEWNFFLG